jgi:predicted nucleic acid-binding protein
VDTDVLVDVALDREPHAEAASGLLDHLEANPGTGFLAWHTVSNFCYLVVPRHGRREPRDFLLELSRFMDVAPTNTESLRLAGRLKMRDFEDAMQVAAAQACEADLIATRNTRDFRSSPITARTPRQLLGELQDSACL